MGPFVEVAKSGLATVLLHPLRSVVTTCALVAVLVPFLAGLGLSNGIRDDAETSIRCGADLYVTGRQLDRHVPLSLELRPKLQAIDGVERVVPRIVGGLTIGKDRESAVLVGIPREHFPTGIHCIAGRLYETGQLNEFVVGSQLAGRLGLRVGSLIPPFYRNDRGEKLSKVVGIFESDVSIWQANLLFTSFDTAADVFDHQGQATGFLVDCRGGYQAQVKTRIERLPLEAKADEPSSPRLQVISKDDLAALLPRGLLHREGIFNLHFVLALAVAILVVLVTSGVGLSERRREIGILKTTGWQTDEILLRGAVESAIIALAGATASVVLAYVWLRGCNGYWIASVFLTGVDRSPGLEIPFRLTPVPVLLTFLAALIVVASGTLYSSWRTAIVPPREVLR